MSNPSTFIDRCLDGTSQLDDIEDAIDEWHEGGTGVPLWTHLGMTRDEYGSWVEDPGALPAIVDAHRRSMEVANSAGKLAPRATLLKDR